MPQSSVEEAKANPILDSNVSKYKDDEHWEFKFLDMGRRKGLLNIKQFEDIISTYCIEAFVSLSNAPEVKQESLQDILVPEALVIPSLANILKIVGQWGEQRKILAHKYSNELVQTFSFDCAPILKQDDTLKNSIDPIVFNTLQKVLTGQHTLWDIAGLLKQNWVSVACVLMPLLQADNLILKIPDDIELEMRKPTQTPPQQSTQAVSSPSKGVIACIDDSPTIAKEIETSSPPRDIQSCPF
ncbi:MAG: hypothetical protein HC810_01160 [Acaryochloridaceae cyanobacterium RL_2_7]|nr:hypothetical protein [Acaryochloridaceae cyanobacterium RL_2_7]